MQISCPICHTTADTDPNRTGVVGQVFPPVGECKCGKTKIRQVKK